MQSYALLQPRGYYVVRDGQMLILCRPDGTKVWRFDPGTILGGEITLAALEDHSELLLSRAGDEVVPLSQHLAIKEHLGHMM